MTPTTIEDPLWPAETGRQIEAYILGDLIQRNALRKVGYRREPVRQCWSQRFVTKRERLVTHAQTCFKFNCSTWVSSSTATS